MKPIVLVSHCLLNPFSKVRDDKEPEDTGPLIAWLMKNRIGIIQLKCPETVIYGLKRWGHVREQFDTQHYRKVSRALLSETIDEVKDYTKNGCRLLAVIGIDGSPSCGIRCSCSSASWGGEISLIQNPEEIKQIEYCRLPGIFMEELRNLLNENGIKTALLAYRSNAVAALLAELQNVLESAAAV